MSKVREAFGPVPLGVNGSYEVKGPYIAGFLATIAGTLTVTSKPAAGASAADVILVDAVPVTAGVYVRLPIVFPATGGTVTLAGGAKGTLFV